MAIDGFSLKISNLKPQLRDRKKSARYRTVPVVGTRGWRSAPTMHVSIAQGAKGCSSCS
jgi:hypothetical protein